MIGQCSRAQAERRASVMRSAQADCGVQLDLGLAGESGLYVGGKPAGSDGAH
jgi:hypothetical protein